MFASSVSPDLRAWSESVLLLIYSRLGVCGRCESVLRFPLSPDGAPGIAARPRRSRSCINGGRDVHVCQSQGSGLVRQRGIICTSRSEKLKPKECGLEKQHRKKYVIQSGVARKLASLHPPGFWWG